MSNIFSFAVEPPAGSDTGKLKAAISKIVRTDVRTGAGKTKLQDMLWGDDTPEYLTLLAIQQIYDDVLDFADWYFDRLSDRSIDLNVSTDGLKGVPESLQKIVLAFVEGELEELRLPPSLIPTGLDSPDLGDVIADKLSGYILTWQDWFWENLRLSRIEDYYELMGVNAETYEDNEYGTLSNSYGEVLDGLTDVPYLSRELGFTE